MVEFQDLAVRDYYTKYF